MDPLSRVGLWGLSWQFLTLLPTIGSLFLLPISSLTPASSYPVLTAIFFIFLALSRLGIWTFSLVAQTLVQTAVSNAQRIEFSGRWISKALQRRERRWWLRVVSFIGCGLEEYGAIYSVYRATEEARMGGPFQHTYIICSDPVPGKPEKSQRSGFWEMPLLPLQLLIAVDSSQGLKRQLSDAIFSFYIVDPVDVFGYKFEPALYMQGSQSAPVNVAL